MNIAERGHNGNKINTGKAELVFTDAQGVETRKTIYDFECGGVLTGQYNKDSSITSFARSCFNYALATKQDNLAQAKATFESVQNGYKPAEGTSDDVLDNVRMRLEKLKTMM